MLNYYKYYNKLEGGVWWQERLAKEFSAPHLVAVNLSHFLATLKSTPQQNGSLLKFKQAPLLALSLNFPHFYLSQDSPGIFSPHLKFSVFQTANRCQVGFPEHSPPFKAGTWKPGFATSTRRIQSYPSTIVHATQGPPCRGTIVVSRAFKDSQARCSHTV